MTGAVHLSRSTWRQPWPPAANVARQPVLRAIAADPISQVDHSDTCISMPEDGVLIVDGVFTLRPELRDLWDVRVWVEVDTERSIRRGARRDADREGAQRAERLHRERYGVAEDIYIAEADPLALADVVVDNNDVDRPRLLRG